MSLILKLGLSPRILVLIFWLAASTSGGSQTPGDAVKSAQDAAQPVSAAMPAAVQARIEKLQADAAAARAVKDAGSEAGALVDLCTAWTQVAAYQKAMDSCIAAVNLSQTANNPRLRAAALNGLAAAYLELSQYDKAIATSQQALDLATRENDITGQAAALHGLAYADTETRKDKEALEILGRALPLAQQAGDLALQAYILRRASIAHADLGDKQEALQLNAQARVFAEKSGNDELLGFVLRGIGYEEDEFLEQHEKALADYAEAFKAFQRAGDKRNQATILNNEGFIYRRIANRQKARDLFEQALSIWRAVGDRSDQAMALSNIGEVNSDLGAKAEALDYFNQALSIRREMSDKDGSAGLLNYIGWVQKELGKTDEAYEDFSKALQIYKEIHNTSGEANSIAAMASVSIEYKKDKEGALSGYNEALRLYKSLNDLGNQARILDGIGLLYSDLKEFSTALSKFQEALVPATKAGNADKQREIYAHIRNADDGLYKWKEALAADQSAMALCKDQCTAEDKADLLHLIAGDYSHLDDYKNNRKAYLEELGLALGILEKNPGSLPWVKEITNIYYGLRDFSKGMEFGRQLVALAHASGSPAEEADALIGVGVFESLLGDKKQALDSQKKALAIAQKAQNEEAESYYLFYLGQTYSDLNRYGDAIDAYNQALVLYQKLGDRLGQGAVSNLLGLVYEQLEEYDRAGDYFQQTLAIAEETNDREGIFDAKGNLSDILSIRGKYKEAHEMSDSVLAHAIENRDSHLQGIAYEGVGTCYINEEKWDKALENYKRALLLLQENGDCDCEARDWDQMSTVYESTGQPGKAFEALNRALPIALGFQDRRLQSVILGHMMRHFAKTNRDLAISFGKQAVNVMQEIKQDNATMGEQDRQSLSGSRTDLYHELADLLISRQRYTEAQEVLNRMKVTESALYLRGDSDKSTTPLPPTPAEEQHFKDYQKSTANLVKESLRWASLKLNHNRSDAEQEEYKELTAKIGAANNELKDYYDRLYKLFGKDSDSANERIRDIKGDTAIIQQQIAVSPKTIALYTVVSHERYTVMVVTGNTTVVHETVITSDALGKKIIAFVDQLQSPKDDPRKAAKELYQILLGDAQKDLDQADAKVLVWWLDGPLRHLPVAALYDGSHFLVEKYASVAVRPESAPYLAGAPKLDDLQAAAMGISRGYLGKEGLPKVEHELDEVVNDQSDANARGVLPGHVLLNDQFTLTAMASQLDTPRTVVHIASHFVFQPGDDESYLVMAGDKEPGQGFALTVRQLKEMANISLDGTELLTLSACQTGVDGRQSNGRDVDGLAVVAQQDKHARAVMASLWEVYDDSTGELMADFYRRWAGTNGAAAVSKAEALRLAQFDLLTGAVKPKDFSDPNAPTNFSHPFYWAPFFLMGNWR